MKVLIYAILLAGGLNAAASMECAGKTDQGELVMVAIATAGSRGEVHQGKVTIIKDGHKNAYLFEASDVSQYFEYDDVPRGEAMVGLAAFVDGEFPLQIKYVGKNYVDYDLELVLEDKSTSFDEGSLLRIWKGPGFGATDQHQVQQIVCSVWAST